MVLSENVNSNRLIQNSNLSENNLMKKSWNKNKNFVKLNAKNLDRKPIFTNKKFKNQNSSNKFWIDQAKNNIDNKLILNRNKFLNKKENNLSDHDLIENNLIEKQINSTKYIIPFANEPIGNVTFEDYKLDISMTGSGYALYKAIKHQKFREIIRLLGNGAHFYAQNGLHGGGPLHQLISLCKGDLVTRFRLKAGEIMLEYGVDVNLVDFYGKTALMLAIEEEQFEMVKLLSCWPKTDHFLQDHKGNTALMYAVLGKKVKSCVELLKSMQFINTNLVFNHNNLITILLRIRNSDGYNVFELAKQVGNREIIFNLTYFLDLNKHQGFYNRKFNLSNNALPFSYYLYDTNLQEASKLDDYWLFKQKLRQAEWLANEKKKNYQTNINTTLSKSIESLNTLDDLNLNLDKKSFLLSSSKPNLRENLNSNFNKFFKTGANSTDEINKIVKNHYLSNSNISYNKKDYPYNSNYLIKKPSYLTSSKQRALSLQELSNQQKYNSIYFQDDESDKSSIIFNNILIKKQNLNEFHLEDLLLSDYLFHRDPYEKMWKQETISWFNKNDSSSNLPDIHGFENLNKFSNLNLNQQISNENNLKFNEFSISNEKQNYNLKKNLKHEQVKLPSISNQNKLNYQT